MRNFKMSGKVIKDFNDSKDGNKFYKANEDTYIADRIRYEELYYKGFVEQGKEVKEEKKFDFRSLKKEED